MLCEELYIGQVPVMLDEVSRSIIRHTKGGKNVGGEHNQSIVQWNLGVAPSINIYVFLFIAVGHLTSMNLLFVTQVQFLTAQTQNFKRK